MLRSLDEYEMKLCSIAPPEVQACWARNPEFGAAACSGSWGGKRTELFREMAVAAGVPSPDLLVELLRHGAPPFGEFPRSGAFAPKEHLASRSLQQVLQAGKWTKAVLRATVRPSSDRLVDEEVAQRTDEEVHEGKAVGPLSEEGVDAILGKCWAPCRRVGLRQRACMFSFRLFSVFVV